MTREEAVVLMSNEQVSIVQRGLGSFDGLVDRLTMLRLVIKDNFNPAAGEGVERAFLLACVPVFAQAMKDMHDRAVTMAEAVQACGDLAAAFAAEPGAYTPTMN